MLSWPRRARSAELRLVGLLQSRYKLPMFHHLGSAIARRAVAFSLVEASDAIASVRAAKSCSMGRPIKLPSPSRRTAALTPDRTTSARKFAKRAVDCRPAADEAAAARALSAGAYSYQSVKNILARGLERAPVAPPQETQGALVLFHEHLRGPEYYS